MKKHDFTIFIVIASLLMCGAAWLVKNRLLTPRAVQAETRAQVAAPAQNPLAGFEVIEPYGAAYDEALGQWSLRGTALLRGASGAFVRALLPGRVHESREASGRWTVVIEHLDGSATSYGGLRAGIAAGRNVERNEIIGQLAGDSLELGRLSPEGFRVDPLAAPE